MNNLDTRTLEETFQRLVHDGEKDAALTVASMAFGSLRGTPRDWLEDNYPNGLQGHNKIQVIKEVRGEFDLGLKEAKAEVDEFEEEFGPNFVETDNIMGDAFIGLSVLIDGEEDEVTEMDPDNNSLQIATAERGWVTPHIHTWKVPADVRS
jgi:hypothetical protein